MHVVMMMMMMMMSVCFSAYDYSIGPMDKALVKTDIQIAVPHGYYGRVGESHVSESVHFHTQENYHALVNLKGVVHF